MLYFGALETEVGTSSQPFGDPISYVALPLDVGGAFTPLKAGVCIMLDCPVVMHGVAYGGVGMPLGIGCRPAPDLLQLSHESKVLLDTVYWFLPSSIIKLNCCSCT